MSDYTTQVIRAFTIESDLVLNIKELEEIYENDKLIPEKWVPINIPGFEHYRVSNKGNVKSYYGVPVPRSTLKRYHFVQLRHRDTRAYHLFGVHRLMALAFIPVPKRYARAGIPVEKLVVNHIDGYKCHNILYNLEWLTVKENMTHAIDTGLVGYLGENSHLATIDNAMAIKICKMMAAGKNNEYISKKTGVRTKVIQHIRSGESWTHISKNYTFPKLGNSIPGSTDPAIIIRICELLQEKKYSDTEIGNMVGKTREYVKDIRLRKRQVKYSKDYTW